MEADENAQLTFYFVETHNREIQEIQPPYVERTSNHVLTYVIHVV